VFFGLTKETMVHGLVLLSGKKFDIQLLHILPISNVLFPDVKYVKGLVGWKIYVLISVIYVLIDQFSCRAESLENKKLRIDHS